MKRLTLLVFLLIMVAGCRRVERPNLLCVAPPNTPPLAYCASEVER